MRRYLNWKNYLLLVAIGIATVTLYYSSRLVKQMEGEEFKSVNTLIAAIKNIVETPDINSSTGYNSEVTLATHILTQNTTIPIIITDDKGNIASTNNVDTNRLKMDNTYVRAKLEQFNKQHKRLEIDYGYGKQFLYYGDSKMLEQLKNYPIILLGIVGVFFIILIIAISNAQKSLQNQVWVGMSKETAHQLGTPLTSVISWLQLLKANEANEEYVAEMEKDVLRLQLIADRFSKIGSIPVLKEENLIPRLEYMVDYMQKRAPIKVNISLSYNDAETITLLSGPLFDWVIENLIRNALDAMEGKGNIDIKVQNEPRLITIDVGDTGKGIPSKNFKKVFQPGYSTKQRGWGLGLSLAKRIVEKYHHGTIAVKSSDASRGTTFRIILRR